MSRRTRLLFIALAFLALLLLAYANHFDNGFYFDDSHTIEHNGHIRDIRNIPSFFTDGSTFSSLPANQAYRPMVTTLNAIDYWIAGGLHSFYFHLSIFFWYVVQNVLTFFVFKTIFDRSQRHEWNALIALFGTAFYALHAANAETVNYIISRSDSFSTMCVVASLFFYQQPATRKVHLYLVPMVVGIYTKQTGVMFGPLLFMYILLFEEDWGGLAGLKEKIPAALKKAAPALVLGTVVFVINQFVMTPASTTSSNTTVTRLEYLITQAHIITHYLASFVLPIRLSADPDFAIIRSFVDPRVLIGVGVIALLLTVALLCFRRIGGRPIAYGILWFFLALAPTSSLVPLYQLGNDHRTFFPYIGLVLALTWLIGFAAIRGEWLLRSHPLLGKSLLACASLLILLHAYGTFQRNRVWNTGESLWYDVTVKSPKNGRGLMNYGLTQMNKGDYPRALEYYERALTLVPRYSYLHVNMAILKDAMDPGDPEVEGHYRAALSYDPANPACYYYYAAWLDKRDRSNEALDLATKGLQLSPGHTRLQALLKKMEAAGLTVEQRIEALAGQARDEPSTGAYLDLSLAYYQAGQYEKCIEAAREVLAISSDSPAAYNNICSAYNKLGRWDEAIAACRRALEIDPGFGRAKNNLKWALDSKPK